MIPGIIAGSANLTYPATLFGVSDKGGFWNAASLINEFQDSAGTTAAAVDAVIGQVRDLSGKANAMIQATTGNKPILKHSGALYSWLFDGTDDYLINATAILKNNTDWEMLIACKPTSSTGVTIYSQRDSGGTPITGIQSITADQIYNIQVRDDASNILQLLEAGGGSHVNTDVVFGARIASGTTLTGSVNGVDKSTGATTQGTTTTTASSIGCAPVASPTQFFKGNVYAVFVISRVLSSGERSALVTYMGALAGLTI